MKRIRVLIVEDSRVVQEHLRRIMSADPRLEVAAAVDSAEEALRVLDSVRPDVISMDIRLPGMQGLEATRRIMSRQPLPIVIVSGVGGEETNLTMEALKAGAVGVVEKPPSASREDYAALAGHLCTQLAILSEVKVVRQRPLQEHRPKPPFLRHRPYRLLAITASTGGPNALMQVLTGLGPGFPLPIAVVQHMTPAFIDGFANWLGTVSPFRVRLVNGNVPLVAGTVYMAPAGHHLAGDGLSVWTETRDPVCGHLPSGTVLFESLARRLGSAALGILLTGMGDDGAAGLLEMRRAGAYTIAEDESTAVVYGMPAAAVRMGAVCESLPLGEIAPRVLELVGAPSEAA